MSTNEAATCSSLPFRMISSPFLLHSRPPSLLFWTRVATYMLASGTETTRHPLSPDLVHKPTRGPDSIHKSAFTMAKKARTEGSVSFVTTEMTNLTCSSPNAPFPVCFGCISAQLAPCERVPLECLAGSQHAGIEHTELRVERGTAVVKRVIAGLANDLENEGINVTRKKLNHPDPTLTTESYLWQRSVRPFSYGKRRHHSRS